MSEVSPPTGQEGVARGWFPSSIARAAAGRMRATPGLGELRIRLDPGSRASNGRNGRRFVRWAASPPERARRRWAGPGFPGAGWPGRGFSSVTGVTTECLAERGCGGAVSMERRVSGTSSGKGSYPAVRCMSAARRRISPWAGIAVRHGPPSAGVVAEWSAGRRSGASSAVSQVGLGFVGWSGCGCWVVGLAVAQGRGWRVWSSDGRRWCPSVPGFPGAGWPGNGFSSVTGVREGLAGWVAGEPCRWNDVLRFLRRGRVPIRRLGVCRRRGGGFPLGSGLRFGLGRVGGFRPLPGWSPRGWPGGARVLRRGVAGWVGVRRLVGLAVVHGRGWRVWSSSGRRWCPSVVFPDGRGAGVSPATRGSVRDGLSAGRWLSGLRRRFGFAGGGWVMVAIRRWLGRGGEGLRTRSLAVRRAGGFLCSGRCGDDR